jgi:hypothetical protein
MTKQTKTWLLVGAGLAALGLLMAFRPKPTTPSKPPKRTSVTADNPIIQTEEEFEADYDYDEKVRNQNPGAFDTIFG